MHYASIPKDNPRLELDYCGMWKQKTGLWRLVGLVDWLNISMETLWPLPNQFAHSTNGPPNISLALGDVATRGKHILRCLRSGEVFHGSQNRPGTRKYGRSLQTLTEILPSSEHVCSCESPL